MNPFKLNQDVKYRTGGVFEPSHHFSLVNQTIQVNKHGNFSTRFPNIWLKYKLPKITEPEIYDNWLKNPMQFWQNQLNFVVWCATSGSGISKINHLQHEDPMIRSLFRFHVYYQIRRILNEMQCPLPTDDSFNPLNNGISMSVFEKICSEFDISPSTNFRQKLDYSNGMGSVRYYSIHHKYTHHHMRMTTEKVLETGKDYDPKQNWRVHIPWDGKVGSASERWYRIEYIEQYFKKQSDTVDASSDGSIYSAIGSFVLDYGKGFTQAGVSRINDSIRTYVWAILGAQSQARSSILGTGKAFDAQKQFLANVEDAINSEVDLPSSIERYQSTLQYARSKVDFVVGLGLYMIPSDMDLYIGTINGYNNLITIATDDLQIGHNDEVNDEPPVVQETFETVPESFDDPIQEPAQEPTQEPIQEPIQEPTQELIQEPVQELIKKEPQDLTHDENKLLLTLAGVALGSAAIWALK